MSGYEQRGRVIAFDDEHDEGAEELELDGLGEEAPLGRDDERLFRSADELAAIEEERQG